MAIQVDNDLMFRVLGALYYERCAVEQALREAAKENDQLQSDINRLEDQLREQAAPPKPRRRTSRRA